MSGKAVRDTLGFLAVVASLMFVGLQLRQSNEWAKQEALQSHIEDWTGLAVPWALDERFSGLAERINTGAREADFVGADRQSLSVMYLGLDHVWEFRYQQLRVGILRADDFRFPAASNLWFNSNFHRDVWPTNRPEFDPDFAAFWEERFDLAQ